MLTVIVAISALLFVGGFLAIWGLYGRHIDDHPLCRRCRFDLIALVDPPDPPAPPQPRSDRSPAHAPTSPAPARTLICPECGSDVSEAAARRTGNRVRSRRKMALGAALILLAALPITLRTAGIGRAAINPYKPLWMLLWEGSSSDAGVAGPALDEVFSRLSAPDCPTPVRASIIRRAVVYQADERLPWHAGWGRVLEWALTSGLLDDAQKRSVAEHAMTITLATRARVREGQEVPYTVTLSPGRIDPASTLTVSLILNRWRGPTVAPPEDRPRQLLFDASPASVSRAFSRARIALPVGTHRLELECSVLLAKLAQIPTPPASGPAFLSPLPSTAAEATLTIPADITIVPADTPVVELIRDESLAPAIRAAIRFRSPGLAAPIAARTIASPGDTQLEIGPVAIDLHARAFYRIDGTEYHAGSIHVPANIRLRTYLTGPWDPSLESFRADTATLVLRFGAEAAEQVLDAPRTWEGVIEFPDMPVNWGPAAPPPAQADPPKPSD